MHNSKKVEFRPPEGFKPPEGDGSGKDWDMVCSFRTKPDGTICLTMLGDTPMPGYDEKAEKHETAEPKSAPNFNEYSGGLMSAMKEGQSA